MELQSVLPPHIYNSLTSTLNTPSAVLTHSKAALLKRTKLTPAEVDKLFEKAVSIVLKNKINTANELKIWQRISLGCVILDHVTHGGVPTKGVTEIVGCAGVGKTQICLQLALSTQLPVDSGGLAASVVYLCTEDVFPSKRLRQLAEAFTHKHKAYNGLSFEDNIYLDHVADIVQLQKCLATKLLQLLRAKKIGLVVVDSIAGIFRSENQNVNYAKRSQDFVSVVSTLTRLSQRHNFAVLCVNQVVDDITTGTTEPCLGLSWSNLVTTRFFITRYSQNQIRELKVAFAPDLPSATCRFCITSEGVVGIK